MSYRMLTGVVGALLIVASSNIAKAGYTLIESADAGSTLSSAIVAGGTETLDAIIGTLPDEDEFGVDMYAIYIEDMSTFYASANTDGTDLFDIWLFLFDAEGRGVAASTTSWWDLDFEGPQFPTRATIDQELYPENVLSGGPGLYYLAVTRLESLPVSASGDIFVYDELIDYFADGRVFQPDGAGREDPLNLWTEPTDPEILDNENYKIVLRRATQVVPTPSGLAVWAGLFGIAVLDRVRRRRRGRG